MIEWSTRGVKKIHNRILVYRQQIKNEPSWQQEWAEKNLTPQNIVLHSAVVFSARTFGLWRPIQEEMTNL
jgi:hypothetical protein